MGFCPTLVITYVSGAQKKRLRDVSFTHPKLRFDRKTKLIIYNHFGGLYIFVSTSLYLNYIVLIIRSGLFLL